MKVNVGCGPFPAPAPWVNTDVIEEPDTGTRPDIVVTWDDPLPFPDGTLDAVYCGHVLEHVPWADVDGFLALVRAKLAPGGEIMVVGPDVVRTLQRWRDGDDPWELVESVLEHELSFQTAPVQWANARHHWNCREDRVVAALGRAGFEQVAALPVTPDALAGWPVVAFTQHQCAVRAVAP